MFHGSLEFPTKNLRMSPNPVDLKDCKQLQTALEPRICSAFLSCFCAGDLLSQFRTYWTDWSYWLWPKDPWVSRHFRNLWISWIYEVLGATNLHPTIQSECRSLIKGLWCTWHHPKNCDRPKLDRQKPDICTYPNAEVPHHRQPNISKAKSWASIFTNDIPSHWSWFAINHISFWTTLDSITTFTTTSYIYIYIKYEHKYIYICVYIYKYIYIYTLILRHLPMGPLGAPPFPQLRHVVCRGIGRRGRFAKPRGLDPPARLPRWSSTLFLTNITMGNHHFYEVNQP